MTVSANDRRIQYTATASQTVFPYDFQIDANTEIIVLQTIYLTGVTNTLTLTTDYTISGVGVSSGGNVTLVTGAAVNDTITIYSSTALTRPTDFNQAGDFFASDVNLQLDRITRILQENETTANRTLLLKPEDTSTSLELPIASERASTFLAFDASGNPIASAGTTSVLVSTFMETLLDDTTAADARATLGITGVPISLGTLAGAANTYTATSSAAYTTYTANDAFLFKVNIDNTGASTINVSSVGVKDLQKFDGAGAATALESEDLQADQYYTAVYNGTVVIVLNPQKPYLVDTNFTLRAATETVAGIAEIATQTEANAGTDDVRFITPLKLANATSIIKQGVAVSASGASVDFTGIPSGTKCITVMLKGVSTNGTSAFIVQIGATTFTTSGYLSTTDAWSSAVSVLAVTNGFGVSDHAAAQLYHGTITLFNIDGTDWVASAVGACSNTAALSLGGGSLALGGTLDRVRITTVNGTDTFDAGSINIQYQ